MNHFLGIDPGLSGALGVVDQHGRFVMVEDMPVSARGSGRVRHEVDAAGLAQLLRPHALEIMIGAVERVSAMPAQGTASMFSLGNSLGVATGALGCLGIPYELLSPSKWKRLAELPSDKALVLAAARRRWPEAPLTLAKHHGRAESLFLALVARSRKGG